MRQTQSAYASPAPKGRFDAERGVFMFPERDLDGRTKVRAVQPGVALNGPNGQRLPQHKPIVREAPGARRHVRYEFNAARAIGLGVIAAGLAMLVVVGLAACGFKP